MASQWLRETPDSRIASYIVASFFTKADIRYDESITLLKKALHLVETPYLLDKPDFYPVENWKEDLQAVKGAYLGLLGWASFKKEAFNDAAFYLEKAKHIAPASALPLYHMGRLQEKRGELPLAIESYIASFKRGTSADDIEGRLRDLLGKTGVILPDDKPLHVYIAEKENIPFFKDVTAAFSVEGVRGGRVAWGDYNNDGLVDVYVANYERKSSHTGDRGICNADVLLINQGFSFRNKTSEWGLTADANLCGRGVSPIDINLDGRLDLYVSNYRLDPNLFWINQGNSFLNVARTIGTE